MRFRRLLVALAIAVLPAACEDSLSLKGTVTVAPDIVAMFSMDKPGLVAANLRAGSGGTWTLGYVCGGTSAAEIPFELTRLGSCSEGTLVVWIEPAPADAKPVCGAQVGQYPKNPPDQPVRQAMVTVFAGKKDCSGSEDNVQVSLQ